MRAGLSTIQQTLTPESAAVLTQSIAEASRRNHGQTTPLHVAATLLSSPSGYLRQACIRSHSSSSHPFGCRALELCFSVALERLPSAQPAAPEPEPPISNALMAALKRAQAHQRRGCLEQQQQPLLAVKVELDQLIISILDDPSVSRVMREAGFSSPAVKAAIEQSLTSSSPNTNHHHHHHHLHHPHHHHHVGPQMICDPARLSTPIIQNPNPYLNPRLQQGITGDISNQRADEMTKLLEIMMRRSKKKNPILVGDLDPEAIVKEFLRKIDNKELGNDCACLKNAQVISISEKGVLSDKINIATKIKELTAVIESRIVNGGVILDLGDLKWLVEVITDYGRSTVVEMGELLARFGEIEGGNNKFWLIGTASCETYLRCQVYYSTMENDLGLQAVPMASRSRFPGIFSRFGTERFSSNLLELLNPVKAFTRRAYEDVDPSRGINLCPQCSENYEKEMAANVATIGKSFSEPKQALPQWLQNAKLNAADAKIADQSPAKDYGLISKQKTQELQKKWRDTCLHLHPNFHQTSLYDPNMLARPIFQPKLPTINPLKETLQLNANKVTNSPPASPVRTDLVLGRNEKFTNDHAKDFLGCISSEPLLDKFANALDADTYKKLLKRLMEKAWWQAEAASVIASSITRCRLGGGKKRGGVGSRGDIWLLFAGPDRVGKKKMASVLAEQICGTSLVTICLGARRDDEESVRGRTAIDRIAEALRRNPFSVIMLDGIDEANALVHGSIKRAIERGRLADSHGREVSIGNAVFVLTGDWATNCNNHEVSRDGRFVGEKKSWQLGLIVREKSAKRRASWLQDEEDRPLKLSTGPGLSFDLNLALAGNDYDKTDGSNNSSDLTVDHEDELSIVNRNVSITSVPHDLLDSVDEAVVFKPFDSAFALREIKKTISLKFSTIVDENSSLEVDDVVLEKILEGLLHDQTSLEEWIEKVVAPSFDRLKQRLPSNERCRFVVCLVVDSEFESSEGNGDWLPSSIVV